MAVDENTYGEVTGVERLIGDIVANRTFGAGTVPTLTQVETELNNVAAELNAALDLMGYSVKIDSTTDPHAYNYVKAANEYGAAARLLATIPTEAYDPDEQMVDLGTSRPQMYERYLNQAMKRIYDRKLRATMSRNRFSRLKTGAQDKSPLYVRRMGEYPGARSLPTPEDEEEES